MRIVYLLAYPIKGVAFGFCQRIRHALTAESIAYTDSECVWFIPGTFAQIRKYDVTEFLFEGRPMYRGHVWDSRGYSTSTFRTYFDAAEWAKFA